MSPKRDLTLEESYNVLLSREKCAQDDLHRCQWALRAIRRNLADHPGRPRPDADSGPQQLSFKF
jgi:hypothetical protein